MSRDRIMRLIPLRTRSVLKYMDQILYQFSKLLTDELLLYIVSTVFHYCLYSKGIHGCSEWSICRQNYK